MKIKNLCIYRCKEMPHDFEAEQYVSDNDFVPCGQTEPKVAFKRFWFWSDWVDVCAFNYGSEGYILQMRRNRFGVLKFRTAKLCGYFPFGVATATIADLPRTKNDN